MRMIIDNTRRPHPSQIPFW